MQQCPKCKSTSIHRSHTRNWLESFRKAMTSNRPHRCQKCGWRGWGQESVPKFDDAQARRAEQAVVAQAADVDLSKL
jgi:predicted RNA-binding Zn-ribbon protein involved in translation (DUF1610 family)